MDTKKMTIYVNPELHMDVKIFAVKANKSISEVTEIALKEYLERNR